MSARGGAGATSGLGGRAQGGSSGDAGGAAGNNSGSSGKGGMLNSSAGEGGSGGAAGGAGGSGGAGATGGASGGSAGAGGSVSVPAIPKNGLTLWLRADVGVMEANGGVQTWLDQSGQHLDAVASALNTAPKLSKDTPNGMPTLEFDGMDDYLSLPTGFADFSAGLSVFIVAKATDGACASMWEVANGSEIQDISVGFYRSTWQYEVENQDVYGGAIDPANAALGVIAVVQRVGGAVELRMNSNLLGQGTFEPPAVASRSVNFIGYTSYANCGHFQGQMSEVIVYDRGLTIAEVNALENYLEKRYGVIVAVP